MARIINLALTLALLFGVAHLSLSMLGSDTGAGQLTLLMGFVLLVASVAGALAARIGLRYRRLTVRTLRTAWGLCNDRRSLTLNWRLVMAPPRVIDYVILHELTHLEYLEHTPRFWRRMERRCPNYRAFEEWIARFGPVLDLEREPDLRRRDGRLRAPLWGARL